MTNPLHSVHLAFSGDWKWIRSIAKVVEREEPLKRAELAMFQTKAAGHNTLRFFVPLMQTKVSARAALEGDHLTHPGCHGYQGYRFSRPLPVQVFETFLRQRQGQE